MIQINEQIDLPDDELSWTFARSGGPGGQNVNKVASKAVLRWEIGRNQSIPPYAKKQLIEKHPSKTTLDGGFLITVQETRDQITNKQIAIDKLIDLIRLSLIVPKVRRKTKPSKSSQQRRINDKKHNSVKKVQRREPND